MLLNASQQVWEVFRPHLWGQPLSQCARQWSQALSRRWEMMAPMLTAALSLTRR